MAMLIGGLAAQQARGASVVLSPQQAKTNGIAMAPLQAVTYRAHVEGIAMVVDPQALTALAAQLATARATVDASNEEVMATAAQAKRQQTLYRNGKFVSERDEQAAVAAAAAAKAQSVTAIATESSARASARASWGAALAALAEHGPDAFADYADGRRALLAVALPIGTAATPAHDIEVLLPDGQTLAASLIGPSPHADAVVQGPAYFYSAAGDSLRSGQRFAAIVPIGAANATGVVIPDPAMLWYAGEPWVYVEATPGHFTRRLISTGARDVKGWFQATGFRGGERVVIRGSELLLSQELKPPPSATPAGDDDD
ncbi:MAG: hypothetical protein EPN75_13505 [Beijerinckiaceae bacterium]|nr:MAG: hypothetical protein EPN75_13505 [Beijerinckiaceae bacterium]